MVYTWCTHVQRRLKSMMSRHMYTTWWPYGGWVIGHEVEAWTLGQEKYSRSMDQCYNYISRDRSCKEFSIEFSCVNPIQCSFPKPILRFLSCNILDVIRCQQYWSQFGNTTNICICPISTSDIPSFYINIQCTFHSSSSFCISYNSFSCYYYWCK